MTTCDGRNGERVPRYVVAASGHPLMTIAIAGLGTVAAVVLVRHRWGQAPWWARILVG